MGGILEESGDAKGSYFLLFFVLFFKDGCYSGSSCGNENDAVGKVLFVTWKKKWVI